MTRPDLVVHAGLGASTVVLSSALPSLGAELARHGVTVCSADAPVAVGDSPVLVVPSEPPPVPADAGDAEAFCSRGVDDVARVVERLGARRAVVVFSPERQDRLLERGYRSAVMAGFAGTPAQLFPRHLEPLIDYRPVVTGLRDIAGVTGVRVVPTELLAAGAPAFVADLLAPLAPDRPFDLAALASWRVPREYGPRGLRIASAMAVHLDTDAERERVREYVLANFSVPVGPAPEIFDDATRSRMLAAYRPVNEAFFAACAPDYPPSAYDGTEAGLAAINAVNG